MNGKVKKTLSICFSLSLILAGGLIVFVPPAHAQTQKWVGVCVDYAPDRVADVATIQGIQCLLGNVLSVAITGLGIIGFVMLIVGSFRYLLSGGNAKGTEGGRNTITFAIIGLVLALSSYIILKLISDFTGVTGILNFHIPNSNEGFGTPPQISNPF